MVVEQYLAELLQSQFSFKLPRVPSPLLSTNFPRLIGGQRVANIYLDKFQLSLLRGLTYFNIKMVSFPFLKWRQHKRDVKPLTKEDVLGAESTGLTLPNYKQVPGYLCSFLNGLLLYMFASFVGNFDAVLIIFTLKIGVHQRGFRS